MHSQQNTRLLRPRPSRNWVCWGSCRPARIGDRLLYPAWQDMGHEQQRGLLSPMTAFVNQHPGVIPFGAEC